MSFLKPEPGRYRRLKDDAEVTVIGCTGTEWIDTVAIRSPRLSHVRLENFWRKYEAFPACICLMHDTLTPGTVRAVHEDALVIPAVGETVAGDFGYFGAHVEWTVVRHEWLSPRAVTLHMTGPTGKPAQACIRCHALSAGVCCSSHGKHLCHLCYRRSHFVEVCVEGCSQCAAEGLPVRLSELTADHAVGTR